MRVDIDFKYNEPVIATVYTPDGLLFMKSEVKVKIPKRPSNCTEAKMDKWKEKITDKISKAVMESLSEHIYGTVNITINGLWETTEDSGDDL